MDGFPAGVGQSCQLYPPSIPPSSVALDLAPGTLLEGYQGCCFGGLRILPLFSHPYGEDFLGNCGCGAEGRSWEQCGGQQGQGDRVSVSLSPWQS